MKHLNYNIQELKQGIESEDGTPVTPVTLEETDEEDDDALEVEGKGNTPDEQIDLPDDDKAPEVEASNRAGNHSRH